MPVLASSLGQQLYQRLFDNIQNVVKGQGVVIRQLLAAFGCGGHVLLEDYPGTGKTTLAKTLAASSDLAFRRIQFTPDLLPSDILGVSILNPQTQTFQFRAGPIFANLILADEINRASPRTQAALLEAMAEGQVTVDGHPRHLQAPFFVIATQNPVDCEGTYPLPEAQMDRFTLKLRLGYVSRQDEVAILDQQVDAAAAQVQACITVSDLITWRRQIEQVRLSEELKRYIVDIVNGTRQHPAILLGASPRGSLALMKVAQALALFDGYEFVTPDHIQEMAVPVLAHRLVMSPQVDFSDRTAAHCVAEIVSRLPVPA